MQQNEIDDELACASELLASTSGAHLAYTVADGTPRVVRVGYFWTGAQFVVATATTAPKVAALSERPDVALTVDAGGTPETARTLSVRGTASITIVDGIVEEYRAAARKSMTEQDAEQFERAVEQMYQQQARIAITPRWARYYDYGAGRMPRFLQELAARDRA